jgi:hypothetical protein
MARMSQSILVSIIEHWVEVSIMDVPLLPTFRLFVMHTKPLTSQKEQDDLRDLFETQAPVTWFMTKRGSWKNSLVTFASTSEVSRARNALQNVQFRGIPLRIEFA